MFPQPSWHLQVATAKCDKLLKALRALFGDTEVQAIDFQSADFVEQVGKWDLTCEDMGGLIRLGSDCEDAVFTDRVAFIQGLLTVAQATVPLLRWWLGTKKIEEVSARTEAQVVTAERVKMMAELRLQFVHFKSSRSNSALLTMFSADGDSILGPILHGKFAAKSVVDNIVGTVEGFLAEVGRVWSSHGEELAKNVKSWCPAGFVDIEKRKALLADAALPKAMIENKAYGTLPDGCNMLASLQGMYKDLLGDGTGLPAPVSKEVLEAMESSRSLGVQCVTWTFGIFLALHQLPKMANDTARAKQVEDFLKQAKGKGCNLDGSDLKAALDGLAKPGAVQAPKAT